MERVDLVFYMLGIFCYFSVMYQLRNQQAKLATYQALQEKKEAYANRLIEQKRRESLAKSAAERKQRNKLDMNTMTSTMQMLSDMADEEVMRQSKITSRK